MRSMRYVVHSGRGSMMARCCDYCCDSRCVVNVSSLPTVAVLGMVSNGLCCGSHGELCRSEDKVSREVHCVAISRTACDFFISWQMLLRVPRGQAGALELCP